MLGPLLGVGQQLGGECCILSRSQAALAGAGDRSNRDLGVLRSDVALNINGFIGFLSHQNLGRCADDLESVEVVVVHIRRWIDRAQGSIQRQRRVRIGLANALTNLNLHHIACDDVLLGPPHGRQIVGAIELAAHLGLRQRCILRLEGRLCQTRLQAAQAATRLSIGIRLGGIRVDDQVELAPKVVDDGQFVDHQHQDIGCADRVGLGGGAKPRLDETHDVIAEIPCQAATEARQSGTHRHLEALLEFADEIQGITLGGLDDLSITQHFDRLAGRAQQHARRQSDEGITAESLTAHHRLEQKTVAPLVAVDQLHIQRQGRIEIGEALGHQRNAVVALSGQGAEFDFSHSGRASTGSMRWHASKRDSTIASTSSVLTSWPSLYP